MKPGSRLGNKPPGQVRIIAGRWRGRSLPVAQAEGLRPTPDRVRETLFNWLRAQVDGARCLDLFAGTGALGFEALSRGAASVVFVDNDPSLTEFLRASAAKLDADNCQVICTQAEKWLAAADQKFDLIFLDPPFRKGLVDVTVDRVLGNKLLGERGLIYIECEAGAGIPPSLQMQKQKIAGGVQYGLYRPE